MSCIVGVILAIVGSELVACRLFGCLAGSLEESAVNGDLGERTAESERRLLVDERSKYCEAISYTGRSIKIGRMHCVEKETKREQRLSM